MCLVLLPQSGFALGKIQAAFPRGKTAQAYYIPIHSQFGSISAGVWLGSVFQTDMRYLTCTRLLQMAWISLVFIMLMPWTGKPEQPPSLTHCARCSSCCVLLSEAHSAEELERRERLRRKQQRQQEFQVLRAKIQDQKPFGDKGISQQEQYLDSLFFSLSFFLFLPPFLNIFLCMAQSFYVLCSQCGVFSQSGPRLTWADNRTITEQDSNEMMLNVLRCQLTYQGQVVTNAEALFNNSLRPWKPEGLLGRTAQDGHLNSHTAPEL